MQGAARRKARGVLGWYVAARRCRGIGSGKMSERANAPPAAAEAAGRDAGPFSAACSGTTDTEVPARWGSATQSPPPGVGRISDRSMRSGTLPTRAIRCRYVPYLAISHPPHSWPPWDRGALRPSADRDEE